MCFDPGEREVAIKAGELVPSPIIDRFWRIIIAHTQGYRKLNERVFRKFSLQRDSRDLLKIDNYNKTLALYKDFFGQADPFLWPPYGSSDSLNHGHHGYLFLPVTAFNRFHEKFVRAN